MIEVHVFDERPNETLKPETRESERLKSDAPEPELACLPLFFPLGGRRIVLAGNGETLVWKAQLLRKAGAMLTFCAAEPQPRLADFLANFLADSAENTVSQDAKESGAPILWHRRAVTSADLHDAVLLIADCPDDAGAADLRALASEARVPLNIIDKPRWSDFQFGAILDQSPLVIGISTAGLAPSLALALRVRLESWLPPGLAHWLTAARGWRKRLQQQKPKDPRRFWSLFSQAALSGGAPPQEADFDRFLTLSGHEPENAADNGAEIGRKGRVSLVGAGPGDPELLTLKALRVLQEADVVLFDDLVSPRIVDMARREAEKIAVGKRGYRPSCRQDHITERLVELGLAGKRVVRLKGGDPMIFGRANEEIAALLAAGIEVEVVPGITAALGAAASLRLSLTERDKARRLQFITAHAKDGSLPQDMDWKALCDPRASTVVYMGVKTLPALAARLLAEGIDPATPAVLIERATQTGERSIHGTIATLPTAAAAMAPDGPCLMLIGSAFAAHAPASAGDSQLASIG
ncbi:siroheme synthase CysG [Beijerinckia mobilis]|uniref:siroheme synthase CysG n=1 Tax=Beijerinckia mobilis TaxID=231434 RepID=UPI00069024EF|nr:siroheme synthase CysG [Beijerinckia mobilis]